MMKPNNLNNLLPLSVTKLGLLLEIRSHLSSGTRWCLGLQSLITLLLRTTLYRLPMEQVFREALLSIALISTLLIEVVFHSPLNMMKITTGRRAARGKTIPWPTCLPVQTQALTRLHKPTFTLTGKRTTLWFRSQLDQLQTSDYRLVSEKSPLLLRISCKRLKAMARQMLKTRCWISWIGSSPWERMKPISHYRQLKSKKCSSRWRVLRINGDTGSFRPTMRHRQPSHHLWEVCVNTASERCRLLNVEVRQVGEEVVLVVQLSRLKLPPRQLLLLLQLWTRTI